MGAAARQLSIGASRLHAHWGDQLKSASPLEPHCFDAARKMQPPSSAACTDGQLWVILRAKLR
eukprot:7823092-Pyramimonas_sp.AAC.1